MPLYPIQCECGNREDVYCRVSELDSKHRPKCPKCGKRCAQVIDSGRGIHSVGNKRFHGKQQRSWEEGWSKRDVAKGRKLMGADGAHCIKDDGTVWFKDAQEAKKYKDKINRIIDRALPQEAKPDPVQMRRTEEQEKRNFSERFRSRFPKGLPTE